MKIVLNRTDFERLLMNVYKRNLIYPNDLIYFKTNEYRLRYGSMNEYLFGEKWPMKKVLDYHRLFPELTYKLVKVGTPLIEVIPIDFKKYELTFAICR